jgi:hypothetical protein
MEMFLMTRTVAPLVKLCVANSFYYDCGMLLTNSIELPTEEDAIREKLKEIQSEDDNGYIVLRGESQFICSIPKQLDIFELNKQLKSLTDRDKDVLKIISKLDKFSITGIVDQNLRKKYRIYENVTCEEDLGRRLYQEDQLSFRIPKCLENYIDFKKIGHEACEKYSIRIIPEMKLAERYCNAS